MRSATLALGLTLTIMAGAVQAQSPMTLEAFVNRANRIPLNPTAMLMPDAHRLKTEAERAFFTVRGEIREARAAGRTPLACPPERISLDARQFLGFLNAIPQSRRQRMTVADGVREWFRAQHPCPA